MLFQRLPEFASDVARYESRTLNGNVSHFKKSITLPVDSSGSSKKSSMSIQSEKSSGSYNNLRDSYVDYRDERKSSAGRKTISDLVQSDPEIRAHRKRGIIAPHAPLDVGRFAADLNYDKFEKDEK